MYEDLRALSGCGLHVLYNRSVNVERVLKCKETHESFCKYAMNVFAKRRMNVRWMHVGCPVIAGGLPSCNPETFGE